MKATMLCVLACLAVLCCGQTLSLDEIVTEEMQSQNIAGISVARLVDSKLAWTRTYGFADKEKNQKVDDSTLFLMASVSKTLTATALMTLWEQGRFQLDDHVGGYLDTDIRNPRHPHAPITFRMLLTHTSSISDDHYEDLPENIVYTYGSDSPISLEDIIYGYLKPGGKYYNSDSFLKGVPGSKQEYSNIGATLIGLLVQKMSGMDFAVYCKQTILEPLGMTQSGWFLRDIDVNNLAMPYTPKGKPIGHYTFPDYPDGQLFTNPTDLSKFLSMFMRDGVGVNGARVLQAATVALMKTVQLTPAVNKARDGLIWFVQPIQGHQYFGHDGAEMGCSTMMFYSPSTLDAAIVLANGEADLDRIFVAVLGLPDEGPTESSSDDTSGDGSLDSADSRDPLLNELAEDDMFASAPALHASLVVVAALPAALMALMLW